MVCEETTPGLDELSLHEIENIKYFRRKIDHAEQLIRRYNNYIDEALERLERSRCNAFGNDAQAGEFMNLQRRKLGEHLQGPSSESHFEMRNRNEAFQTGMPPRLRLASEDLPRRQSSYKDDRQESEHVGMLQFDDFDLPSSIHPRDLSMAIDDEQAPIATRVVANTSSEPLGPSNAINRTPRRICLHCLLKWMDCMKKGKFVPSGCVYNPGEDDCSPCVHLQHKDKAHECRKACVEQSANLYRLRDKFEAVKRPRRRWNSQECLELKAEIQKAISLIQNSRKRGEASLSQSSAKRSRVSHPITTPAQTPQPHSRESSSLRLKSEPNDPEPTLYLIPGGK